MVYTAEELDRHIQVLYQLEKENIADTLSAYADIVQRVAAEGEVSPDGTWGRVPSAVVEAACRLRGIETRVAGVV